MEIVTTQSVIFITMWTIAPWGFQKDPQEPQLNPVGLVGTMWTGFQFQLR